MNEHYKSEMRVDVEKLFEALNYPHDVGQVY